MRFRLALVSEGEGRADQEEIKAVDPEARVAFGGTAGCDLGYIDRAYRVGAKSCCDIMNVHPYCSSWRVPIRRSGGSVAWDNGMYRAFINDAQTRNPNMRIVGLTVTPYRLGVGHVCHKEECRTWGRVDADRVQFVELAGWLGRGVKKSLSAAREAVAK